MSLQVIYYLPLSILTNLVVLKPITAWLPLKGIQVVIVLSLLPINLVVSARISLVFFTLVS